MNIDDFGEYVIIVVNLLNGNSKYCSTLGSYSSEKVASNVCRNLNKKYAKQLGRYNCLYEYLDRTTL